jgi:NADH:ubiquinone oxidoreductase subunit H
MLLMIFLAEYLHLIIASIHFVLFFMGGWYGLEYLWFLPPIFITPYSGEYWYALLNQLLVIL